VGLRVAKKQRGKKVAVVEAEEYIKVKRRTSEIEDALEKIARGGAAYRQGRTKTVRSLLRQQEG
jgi:hypothetical protein